MDILKNNQDVTERIETTMSVVVDGNSSHPFSVDHPILVGERRYAPFRVDVGGEVYSVATDGCCAHVVEDPGSVLPLNEERSPAFVRILSEMGDMIGSSTVGKVLSVADGVLKSAKSCDYCEGTGVEHRKDCLDCEGQGELECDLGHFHTCTSCDGEGYSDASPGDEGVDVCACAECRGKKRDQSTLSSICLDLVELDPELLCKSLSALDPLESVDVHVAGRYDPVQFVGSNWRVIVAPVVPGTMRSSVKLELDGVSTGQDG